MTLPLPNSLIAFKITLTIMLILSLSAETFAQCASGNEASFTLKTYQCDSLTAEIINTSSLALEDVSYFKWDFGNGDSIVGDSTINSEFYIDENEFLSRFYKYYYDEGSYDISLIVADKLNCRDTFEIKDGIVHERQVFELIQVNNRPETHFYLKDGPPNNATHFRWNFGDPAAGPNNYNDKEWDVTHAYQPGSYLVSLWIRTTSYCDHIILDTVEVNGPAAIIEAPYNRIAYEEKYQCNTNDTIHFTNNSIYYRNDSDPTDEDSLVVINGESMTVFDYDPNRIFQEHYPILSASHLQNRTNEHVVMVWDFGDNYAPQCTTSTVLGINVGINCNFSTDEEPAHKYTDWDSIYHYNSFILNDSFSRTVWVDSLNNCYVEYIDTSYAELHRKMFDWYYVKPYQVHLWMQDSTSLLFSEARTSIVIGRPNARKLMTDQSNFCAVFENDLSNYIEFDLNTGGQSYFAVNFDSLSDPNNFKAFNSGAVLAPPAPGSALPFVLPYDVSGNYPDKFIKGYTPEEVGALNARSPEGSFSLGVIVGNGAIASGESTPECMDTAWYHNMFRIIPLNSEFDIIGEDGPVKTICSGDHAYFQLQNDKQYGIKTLSWNWGYIGEVTGLNLDLYTEEFYYLEDYNGPVSGRNDENIIYNNENWKYNYIIRSWITDVDGIYKQDTIVTSIIKDWKTEFIIEEDLFVNSSDPLPYPSDVDDPAILKKMLGTCIDTTGLSQYFNFKDLEYRKENNDKTYILDNKRYRYTNASKTDSVEVAHILHFRDSSLRGYDTLFTTSDTITGLWDKRYTYTKDGEILNSNGPMQPSLRLTNNSGCQHSSSHYLNVGFLNRFWLDSDTICNGLVVNLNDSLRYWQYGKQQWPDDYPIDPTDYWNTPSRYLNNYEIYELDWDTSDGLNDWERSIQQSHIYTEGGDYVITVHSKDSLNCHDTFQLPVHITEINTDFIINDQSVGCNYNFKFKDSITVIGSDSIIKYEWEIHGLDTFYESEFEYTLPDVGRYTISLVAYSEYNCYETEQKEINVRIPSNFTTPKFTYSVNDLQLTLLNQSAPEQDYVWFIGDSNTDTSYNSIYQADSAELIDICLRLFDTSANCTVDSCIEVAIGNCNALFGYLKDTTSNYTIVVIDSSSGQNLEHTWYWGDGDSSVWRLPSHEYDTFGKYLITLKVENTNCISIYSDSLGMDSAGNLLKVDGFKIVVTDFAVIGDLPAGEALIYPNPASNVLNVAINAGQLEEVQLFDINGKKHEVAIISKAQQIWQLQVAELTGSFVLNVKTDRGYLSYKVIIE